MEKKIWTAPKAEVEQFMANEYVAACGAQNTVYNFECDAPAGTLYYYPQYSAANAQPESWPTQRFWGQTTTAADKLGNYTPCGEKHEASSQNPFYWGFVDYNRNSLHDSNETVIVWRGKKHNNGHATVKLDMTQWETAKS